MIIGHSLARSLVLETYYATPCRWVEMQFCSMHENLPYLTSPYLTFLSWEWGIRTKLEYLPRPRCHDIRFLFEHSVDRPVSFPSCDHLNLAGGMLLQALHVTHFMQWSTNRALGLGHTPTFCPASPHALRTVQSMRIPSGQSRVRSLFQHPVIIMQIGYGSS